MREYYSIETTVEPAEELVDLFSAKKALRVSHCLEDDLILEYSIAARKWAESDTGRRFINQSLVVKSDCLWSGFRLPRGPVQSITSIKYRDSANAEQTVSSSNYMLVREGVGSAVILVGGYTLPALYDRPDAVTIEFVAGYGTTRESVPAPIVAAVKLRIRDIYEHTEENIKAARSLLSPYTMDWL